MAGRAPVVDLVVDSEACAPPASVAPLPRCEGVCSVMSSTSSIRGSALPGRAPPAAGARPESTLLDPVGTVRGARGPVAVRAVRHTVAVHQRSAAEEASVGGVSTTTQETSEQVKAELIDRAIELARSGKGSGGPDHDRVADLLHAYYRHVAPEDLVDRS